MSEAVVVNNAPSESGTPSNEVMREVLAGILNGNDQSKNADAVRKRVVDKALTTIMNTAYEVLYDLGAVSSREQYSMLVSLDVHGMQLGGIAMAGNPARTSRNAIQFMSDVLKNGEYENLADMLGVERYDNSSREDCSREDSSRGQQ